MSLSTICKNCNTPLHGEYCHLCGQKVLKNKRVLHLVQEGFKFITNIDGHVFNTFKSILFLNGKFSSEYIEGKRKRYLKPVNALIFVILIYLLIPILQGLNMEFNNYEGVMFFTDIVQDHIEEYKIESGMTLDQIQVAFDKKSSNTAKFVILLFIPFFTIIIWLLHSFKRKDLYDLVIIGIELSIFYVLGLFVVLPLFLLVIANILKQPIGENTLSIIFLITLSIVASRVFKKCFNQSWFWSILKGVVFTILAMIYMFSLHKYLVFLLTMIQL